MKKNWWNMKRLSLFGCLSILALFVAVPSHAAPFGYELWMPTQTSIYGPLKVTGKIVNIGTVPLDLNSQWGALGGLPGNLNETATGLSEIYGQLSAHVLYGGESFNLTWLESSVGAPYAGGFLEAGLGFIPYQSDWRWLRGGFIPGLTVKSEWITGLADASAWNVLTIDLVVADGYIKTSPLAAVPTPPTVWLLGSGLVGLLGLRKRFNK